MRRSIAFAGVGEDDLRAAPVGSACLTAKEAGRFDPVDETTTSMFAASPIPRRDPPIDGRE